MPEALDPDRDGLIAPFDQCPTEPEDRDGFRDDDGCPEFDNDRDSISIGTIAASTSPRTKMAFKTKMAVPTQITTMTAFPIHSMHAQMIA